MIADVTMIAIIETISANAQMIAINSSIRMMCALCGARIAHGQERSIIENLCFDV